MIYRITVIEHSIGPWDWRVHIPGWPDEYVASGTARTRRKARKAAERAARNHATPFAGRTETYEVTP